MHVKRYLAVALATAAVAGLAAASASARTSAKTIVFCSDTTYPPMESIVNGKPAGADIDIANALAKQLGATAQIKTTGFDVIIPALMQKKCDAIISAMTNTPARAKQVHFTNYITVGAFLMVKKGNPSKISTLDSLSGKTVAVEAATTEGAALAAQNKVFAKQGKKPVTVKTYPADTSAAAAILAGKVDAYFADAPPVLYYIKTTKGKFESAGKQIESAPEGIATRKGDPLGARFAKGIDTLYKNGTMTKILAKWGLSAFALKK